MLTRHAVGRRMGVSAHPLLVYGGGTMNLYTIPGFDYRESLFNSDLSSNQKYPWPSNNYSSVYWGDFFHLYNISIQDISDWQNSDSGTWYSSSGTIEVVPKIPGFGNDVIFLYEDNNFKIGVSSFLFGDAADETYTFGLATVCFYKGNSMWYFKQSFVNQPSPYVYYSNVDDMYQDYKIYMQKGMFGISYRVHVRENGSGYRTHWNGVVIIPPLIVNPQTYVYINTLNSYNGNKSERLTKYSIIDIDLPPSNEFPPGWLELPDPMEPIGPSGPGGGNGSFDKDSDIIEDSSLPTLSAADTGFTRIYSPTLSQVQALARYLWTDETVIETIWNKIKQIFENPMDAIIAFNLVPVPVEISGTKNFALMYIDTGVSMNTVQNQFVDVDCGTFEIKEYYGSALDYSPNTKISCFLPFIGVVTLNTDEVMNTTLQVKYRVDIVSGSCVAKVFVNGSVLYQFSGHCSIPIPFTASDYSSYLSAAIGVAKLAIGAAVGGGAGAAAAGASEIDVEQATQGIDFSNMSADESVSATMAAMDEARSKNTTAASYKGIASQNITNVVGTVMGAKLHVEHSGSFSGNTGYLGVRRPYLIIQRPRMCMPNEYRKFNGYPSMITLNIGDCKGYTKVQQIQLQGVSATNPEQSEILQLLKGGIII